MTQYQVVKGSLQALPDLTTTITCNYNTDLIWVSAAWQRVVPLYPCGASEDRWDRYAAISGLPNPNTLADGTVMDDGNGSGNGIGALSFAFVVVVAYILYEFVLKGRK